MSRPRSHECGFAVLAIMLLLVVAASLVLVKRLNAAADNSYRLEFSITSLNRAKEALIGIAATYPDSYPGEGPGQLPCPDTDQPPDGSPNPPCGPDAIGRLPWRFFGMNDIRDSSGEPLWYAVSNAYRNNPKTVPLNSNTPGELTVDGNGDIVAIVFSPGPSVTGQNRPSSTVTDYLEGSNSDGDQDFSSQGAGEFNDLLTSISRRELMAFVEKRVIGEARQALRGYFATNNYYPFAAPLGSDFNSGTEYGMTDLRQGFLPLNDPPPGPPPGASANPRLNLPPWFTTNLWQGLVYYSLASGCTANNPNCSIPGRLVVGSVGTVEALVASAGSALSNTNCNGMPYPAQNRPSNSVCDYLDSLENTDADDAYDRLNVPISPTYNEQLRIVAP